MSIPTIGPRPHGSARDVLDWIAFMLLVDHVSSLSDSSLTALSVLPVFLKGNQAAKRGSALA